MSERLRHILQPTDPVKNLIETQSSALKAKDAAARRSRLARCPWLRAVHNLRFRIRLAIHRQGGRKDRAAMQMIGCTPIFLRDHLEKQFLPGMSWANYGQWHVDHIRPCASFDLRLHFNRMRCFHWTNLQPLWGQDNFAKGAIWNGVNYTNYSRKR